eukprot:11323558-Heterocapsa_arctica.AAC.1
MLRNVDDHIQFRSVGRLDISREGGSEVSRVVSVQQNSKSGSAQWQISGEKCRAVRVHGFPIGQA